MVQLWQGLLELIEQVLRFFHSATAPLFGPEAAWGWAIILLTVAVRVLLLPLAIKQIRSQRAMQRLAPEMQKIQAKFKVDRGLMRTNPEKYREQRTKQQEAVMALYKEHGVNPAAGCLPLLPQLPVFFALFSVLRGDSVEELQTASFYILGPLAGFPGGLLETWGAWLLVLVMGLTTYYSSRQMMANTPATGPQAQQQKILMYAMPLILVVFAQSMPVGVLLYWVTTNVWTIAQQAVMFRDAAAAARALPAAGAAKAGSGGGAAKAGSGGGAAKAGSGGGAAKAGSGGGAAKAGSGRGAAKSGDPKTRSRRGGKSHPPRKGRTDPA